MAGLRLVPASLQADPSSARAEELSELSGLIAGHGLDEEEEEERERGRDTDEEYEIVQKEEARDMPSEYLHNYGTLSPRSRRRRRRKRRNSWRRRSGSVSSYTPLIPSPRHHHRYSQPYFSLSPQALREGGDQLDVQRAWGSTSAIPQVSRK